MYMYSVATLLRTSLGPHSFITVYNIHAITVPYTVGRLLFEGYKFRGFLFRGFNFREFMPSAILYRIVLIFAEVILANF